MKKCLLIVLVLVGLFILPGAAYADDNLPKPPDTTLGTGQLGG